MKSRKVLWEVCMDIYREMYRKATPRADFDRLIADKVTMKSNWFMYYYLSVEEQELIINTICKRNGLTKRERERVAKEVQMGSSPNSSLETWRDLRKAGRKGRLHGMLRYD